MHLNSTCITNVEVVKKVMNCCSVKSGDYCLELRFIITEGSLALQIGAR